MYGKVIAARSMSSKDLNSKGYEMYKALKQQYPLINTTNKITNDNETFTLSSKEFNSLKS